jgi:hypothetical protein
MTTCRVVKCPEGSGSLVGRLRLLGISCPSAYTSTRDTASTRTR